MWRVNPRRRIDEPASRLPPRNLINEVVVVEVEAKITVIETNTIAGEQASENAGVTMGQNQAGQKCVLVLDDDVAFQDLMGNLLRAHGYEAVAARTAAEASFILAAGRPSLLIVDYRLPAMDGISWIASVREAGNNIPIIFVSGTWCDAKTFNWLRNILKVSLIFQKPIDPHLFMQAVEDVLPASAPTGLEPSQEPAHESLPKAEYAKFLEKGNFDETLAKIDALIVAESTNPVAVNELTQIRRKVRTQKVVHAARVQYIGNIPAIWNELANFIREAKDTANDPALLHLARDAAHKLKGTSGSYGLSHISEVAAHLESFLDCVDPSCTAAETNVYWSEIDRILVEGNAVIDGLTHIDIEDNEGKEERLISLLLVSPDNEYLSLMSSCVGCNIDVHVVNSAIGAETKAKSMPFDVAVIDLNLGSPELIGALTKELRSVRQFKQMPFIFIADPSQYSSFSELIYGGCSALLEPPVSDRTLVDVVTSLRGIFKNRQSRVLCVDDDPMLTFFRSCVLNQEGMEVQVLNEPIHILETLDSFQPDLILLDVMMPGLSGYEVCRMLRSQKEWRHTPIVFLTAKTDTETRGAAFRAGGNDFLSKPVVSEELIARVNAHLAEAEMNKRPDSDEAYGVLKWEPYKKQASRVLQQCKKENIPASVGVIVVEGFNQLDFKHGDFAKQQVLAEVGALLSLRFRTTDVRGMLKDGAFSVLFRGEGSITAQGALALLQEEIGRIAFTCSNGNQFHVVLKVGLADEGVDGLTFDSLVQCATLRVANSEPTYALSTGHTELREMPIP